MFCIICEGDSNSARGVLENKCSEIIVHLEKESKYTYLPLKKARLQCAQSLGRVLPINTRSSTFEHPPFLGRGSRFDILPRDEVWSCSRVTEYCLSFSLFLTTRAHSYLRGLSERDETGDSLSNPLSDCITIDGSCNWDMDATSV